MSLSSSRDDSSSDGDQKKTTPPGENGSQNIVPLPWTWNWTWTVLCRGRNERAKCAVGEEGEKLDWTDTQSKPRERKSSPRSWTDSEWRFSSSLTEHALIHSCTRSPYNFCQ